MPGSIEKGTLTNINAGTNKAKVKTASGVVTGEIVIPWHMRGISGNLAKGTEVVFVLFDDHTGLLLGRADGSGP